MQTILSMIQKAGGWRPGLYLRIDHAPYMALVVEALDKSGPCGLPAVSVCHYGQANGDAMRDPEMLFELSTGKLFPLLITAKAPRPPTAALRLPSRSRQTRSSTPWA